MNQRKNFSYAKYGYIFSIPFVLIFLVFSLSPLVYTFRISVTDRAGVPTENRKYSIQTRVVTEDGLVPTFDILGMPILDDAGNPVMEAGQVPVLDASGSEITKLDPLGNFRIVLQSERFRTALQTTAIIWTANFIPQLLLAIILAAWFTSRWSKIRGQGLFKVLFYMPNIITAGTIAMMFGAFFMFPQGVVNDALVNLGLLDKPKEFSADTTAQRLIVAFIQFWMWYGYTMLILISGILGLNPQMYESADIDGAGAVKQFFFITLPNLRTILIFTLVTSLIGGLNMFDIPWMYANGGPAGGTTTSSLWIYNQAFAGSYRYNTASAASIIIFLIIAVLSAIIFFILRDKDEAKLNKIKKAEAKARKEAELAKAVR